MRKKITHTLIDQKLVQCIHKENETSFITFDGNEIKGGLDQIPLKNGDILKPVDSVYIERNIYLPSKMEELRDGDELFMDLLQYFKDNILLNDDNLLLITAYTWYTWFYDRLNTAPYLYIQGDYQTGKSRLLDLMSHTAFNATVLGTAVTNANIYRMVEIGCGTLFIDEFEVDLSNRENIFTQILNEGYRKGGVIVRSERGGNGTFEPIPYKVFGPKVMASRSLPNDVALASRCFLIKTEKTITTDLKVKKIPLDFTDEQRNRALVLRNRLLGARFRLFFNRPIKRVTRSRWSTAPRDEQLIGNILSVQPSRYVPDIEYVLFNALSKTENIPTGIGDNDLLNIIKEIIITRKRNGQQLPYDILYKEILDKIVLLTGLNLHAKTLGKKIKGLGFEKVAKNDGTAIRINSFGILSDESEGSEGSEGSIDEVLRELKEEIM